MTHLVTPASQRQSTPTTTRRPRADWGHWAVNAILLVLALLALTPFVMLLSSSFTSEASLSSYGYNIFPREFSTEAYRFMFRDSSQLFRSYGVTVFVTVVGTALGLSIMSMLAFALSRREFALCRPLSFYVFFTMLFNGGLVPWFILITQYLDMRNTIWVLILPMLVIPWYVLLLRTFFAGLPNELFEAARIDGASEWTIFLRLALPLSTPALATIGLFQALGYWNDWWHALLFIDDRRLAPLQYLMYIIQSNIDAIATDPNVITQTVIPSQAVRMAMAVLAIGPIIFAFLFAQKYFVRGVTLGGLKE